MTLNGWIQIATYFAVLTALVVPLGRFMARVFEGEWTFLTPVSAALAHTFGRMVKDVRQGWAAPVITAWPAMMVAAVASATMA